MTRSAQETLEAHVAAVASGDMHRILADYSEDATIITGQGALHGHPGVEAFYATALQTLPQPQFAITDVQYSGNAALVHWTARSSVAHVDDGVDTFVFASGEIVLHTVHLTVQPL